MRNTNRAKLTISAMLALLALGAAIAAARTTNGPGPNPKRTHVMEADYLVYTSLGEIAAKSDIVIRGTVVEVLPSYRVMPPGAPMDQLPAQKAADLGYLQTDLSVRVDHLLFGDARPLDSNVVVSQLGGEDAENEFVMKDAPMSRQGESYVFFLARSANGRYSIVGGTQGRYLVDNGRLVTFAESGQELPLTAQLSETDLASFEANFDKLVRAAPPEPQVVEIDEPVANQENLPLPSPEEKPKAPAEEK